MKKIFLLIIIMSACFGSEAQSWQDTIALVEHIFSRYKPANPGCQLAISRNGQIIFSQAWGMADLEHNVPLTTESVIEAGSVSKQFTAACILLLEQQGKLSLDDNVRKYIPELPDYGTPVLLRNMMHHTSGLKDWDNIIGLTGLPEGSREYDNDDILDIVSRQRTLNNKPGDEFLYSNSNYNLLAIIIERVSGMDLAAFSRKYIFEPAGMKHTRWRNHFRAIVPNRAIAYGYNGDFYFTDMPNENVYGNGGLLTTAEDLLAWNNFYLSGKFGNPSLLPRQLETNRLNNGYMHNFAAGFYVALTRGWKDIGMEGSTAAYRCNLTYFPDFGLSFAWISNTSQFDRDIEAINDAVWGVFVKEKQSEEQKYEPLTVSVSSEKLASDAGWFRNTRSGEALRLFVKKGKLVSSKGGSLLPIGGNVFMMEDGAKIILLPTKGKSLLFTNYGIDTVLYLSIDSAHFTKETMKDYVGEYYSEEVQAKFIVLIKDGKLVLQENPHDDQILNATYQDGFNYWRGIVYFERDKERKITGMYISLPRARNLAFKKL